MDSSLFQKLFYQQQQQQRHDEGEEETQLQTLPLIISNGNMNHLKDDSERLQFSSRELHRELHLVPTRQQQQQQRVMDEPTHIEVRLPLRRPQPPPPPIPSRAPRHHRQPPAPPPRQPAPPVVPPRPRETLSPWTRDLSPVDDELFAVPFRPPPMPEILRSPIRLTEPRPDEVRNENHYIDSPAKLHDNNNTTVNHARNNVKKVKNPHSKQQQQQLESDPLSEIQPNDESAPSIICADCGKCKCLACQKPRPLPETWICDKTVRVSADSVVDCVTCMSVARAVRYHCGSTAEDDSGETDKRWNVKEILCLGLASICLPCLCCYWPLKLCSRAVGKVYSEATSNSCHCPGQSLTGVAQTQHQRQLDQQSPLPRRKVKSPPPSY